MVLDEMYPVYVYAFERYEDAEGFSSLHMKELKNFHSIHCSSTLDRQTSWNVISIQKGDWILFFSSLSCLVERNCRFYCIC